MPMIIFLLGASLVNSLPALVLFDSGMSRPCVSRSFSRGFSMTVGKLACPLPVSITNEHGVSTSSVYQGCVLEIFRVPYPIDLISISMGDVCVILGMDWLSSFDAMI